MAGNYQQTEKKKPRAPFDLFSLTMWTPNAASGKNASLNWGVNTKGEITITCRSGNPADKDKTKNGDGDVIRAAFPVKDFEVFLGFFNEAIRAKGEYKKFIDMLGWYGLVDGQRKLLDKPRTESTLTVGKDSDGKMFIALTKYKRDSFEFGFVPDRPAFLFKHASGELFTNAETSVAYAGGYYKNLSNLFEYVTLSDLKHKDYAADYEERFDPKKAFANNTGGAAGGQQRSNNGGNGGGNNRPSAAPVDDMDDSDMPY